MPTVESIFRSELTGNYDARHGHSAGASAVALAAFCIWLAVRIVNRRGMSPRMTWAAAITGVVLFGYVLSCGPACRLLTKGVLPYSHFERAYQPCTRLAIHGCPMVRNLLGWWVEQCGGGTILAEENLEILRYSDQTTIGPFPGIRIWYGPPWTYLCGHFWPCYAGCIALFAATLSGLWRVNRTRAFFRDLNSTTVTES